MRSFRRQPVQRTTDLAAVEEQWPGSTAEDTAASAYERNFRVQTPVSWDIVEQSQRDLLRLLVDRVPAEIGVNVILALNSLFASHPKGDDAARALLSSIVTELPARLARTLLLTLADAQVTSESQPYDNRSVTIRTETLRTTRRLLATDLGETDRNTLEFIHDLLSAVSFDGSDNAPSSTVDA